MSANTRSQPRQPKGVPAGGQWRPASRAEGPSLKAGSPTLADFLDGAGNPIFPDPDVVGTSEYRAVHELLSDLLDSVDAPSPGEAPLAYAALELDSCLVEVEDWTSTLRERLRPLLRSA